MSKKSISTRFSVGDHVRVKAGVSDPDYPDMPLGGWAGAVAENESDHPLTYLVRFDRRTLANVHPVYRNRCKRDGLVLDEMSLREEDLEPDTGASVPIEQPKNIVSKPLSVEDQDDRLRAIFGLISDDPVPEVDEESLVKFYKYLVKRLTTPFEAEHCSEAGPLRETSHAVKVLGLLDPMEDLDEHYGLFGEARHGKRIVSLPLSELEMKEGKPNCQLIEDYSYWFWNWR